MKRIIALVGLAFLLAGCQSIPPLNFSVPDVGISEQKLDAELRSMTVTLARPDEKKGDLPLGSEGITQLWQTALQEALDRMVVFRDDADRKVNLQVKVLAVDIPSFGASFTTKTIARYEIIDRQDGSIIYSQEIAADGTTPMDFAFMGIARARESINRSVQNNIATFLNDMQTIDITKPMFPAQAPSQVSQ